MRTRQFEKELRKLLQQNNFHCFVSAGFYVELPKDYMVEILSGKHMNLWQDWNFKEGKCGIVDRYENLKGLEPEEAYKKILDWSK